MKREPPKITDEEEADLIESSERGEWVSVGNIEEQREWWRQAALRKMSGERQRISIAIPKRNLARIRTIAAEEGVPYQTLINSILHKFVEGR